MGPLRTAPHATPLRWITWSAARARGARGALGSRLAWRREARTCVLWRSVRRALVCAPRASQDFRPATTRSPVIMATGELLGIVVVACSNAGRVRVQLSLQHEDHAAAEAGDGLGDGLGLPGASPAHRDVHLVQSPKSGLSRREASASQTRLSRGSRRGVCVAFCFCPRFLGR